MKRLQAMTSFASTGALLVWLVFLLASCNQGKDAAMDIPATDSVSIARGNLLFQQNCTSCHRMDKDGIGPALAGVTAKALPSWIRQFIRNPKAMIDGGDSAAVRLFARYHTVMPSFNYLADSSLNQLIAFLNSSVRKKKEEKIDPNAIKDPLPQHITASAIVGQLKLLTTFPPTGKKEPITRISKMDRPAGGLHDFMLDQNGLLYQLVNNRPVVFLDMQKWKPHFVNEPGLATGFGSFAFHPDYVHNGLFYTTHAEKPSGSKADFGYADSLPVAIQWVLSEWRASRPAADTFSGTCRELLRINVVSTIHGMQDIAFNPYARKGNEDYGLLYIGMGEGGSMEAGYPFLEHSTGKIWGTVLRIDPAGKNSANGKYGIPPSNPFVHFSAPGTVKEIYALGFRNPNRFCWTSNGQQLITNIGQAHIESVNLLLKGHDYGWPLREGNFAIHPDGDINQVYPLPANDSQFHFTYPVAEFDHDDGHSIIGGFEYSGNQIPELRGKYLFGDITSGRLFYIDTKGLTPGRITPIKEWFVSVNGKRTALKDLSHTGRVDLRFGTDPGNRLFIFTKADGKLYEVVR